MIAGEFEGLVGNRNGQYDTYFGKKKKKKKPEKNSNPAPNERTASSNTGTNGNSGGEKAGADSRSVGAGKEEKDNLIKKGVNYAKDQLDKNGGIDGLKETGKNVTGYFKDDSPSDFDVNIGKKDEEKKKEDEILGMPSMYFYGLVGVSVILLGVGFYHVIKTPASTVNQFPTEMAAGQ